MRAALLLALLLGGCTELVDKVISCEHPPPLRSETVPKPPINEDEQVWQPGHWDYDGRTYHWQQGAWVLRGDLSGQWVSGYWTRDQRGAPCQWVSAHWL